jgi:glutathione S-transferase
MDWFNTQLYRELGYHLVYPQLFPHHKRASDEVTNGTVAWGKDKTAAALEILDRHMLGDNAYVCGSALTIADLFGAQLVCAAELVGADYAKYPKIKAWIDRVKALPSWPKVSEAHEGFKNQLKGQSFVNV